MSLTYNATASSCAKWRAALARQASGGAHARLFVAGDSITAGYNGSPGNHTASWAWRLFGLLNTHGGIGPVEPGFHYTTRSDSSYPDTRQVLGAGWAESNDGDNIAGWGEIAGGPGPTADTFAFGPVVCDEFQLATRSYPGNPTIQWKIDNGSWSSDVPVVTGTITIPAGTAGPHTLHIRATSPAGPVDGAPSGVYVVLMALGWTDSTRDYVRTSHLGVFGIRLATWVDSLSHLYGRHLPAPDLTVVHVGTNDEGNLLPLTDSVAQLTGWIDAARAADSDVMLVIPPPLQASDGSERPTTAYRTALFDLAASKDVPLVDLQTAYGTSWSTARLGTPQLIADGAHPTDAGMDLSARVVRDAVLEASGIPVGPTVGRWDGSQLQPVTIGRWDGTALQPVTITVG